MPSEISWTEADFQASERLTWESVYPEAASGRRSGKHIKIVCPFIDHADTDASCALYDDGKFHCYGCTQKGGMAKFLVLSGLISDWGDALKHVQSLAGITRDGEVAYQPVKPKPKKPAKPEKDWRAEGVKLWEAAQQNFRNTVGSRYLEHRCPKPMAEGIFGKPDGFTNTHVFRYLPATSSATPSWVKEQYSQVGGLGGILIAQYSYPRVAEAFEVEGLTKDGRKAPKEIRWRQTWGSRAAGSACFVWAMWGDVLVVCEGVLSAFAAPWCLKQDDGFPQIKDVSRDIGAVVAVGGKENYMKFATKLQAWLDKTECNSVIVCAEVGEEDICQQFKSYVEAEYEIDCYIHEHDRDVKGWDCCDNILPEQESLNTVVEAEPAEEIKSESVPKDFKFDLEEADPDGFVLLITDMSKEDERFFPAYTELLVDNKQLKYIKDDEDICTVRSVAYLANGKLSDFSNAIPELVKDLNTSYTVCLATDREEYYSLFEKCEEIITPVFLEQPQAEIIVLDDKRTDAENDAKKNKSSETDSASSMKSRQAR